MIPILYPPNETKFDTNGYGKLTDTIECVVVQDDKGTFELALRYPLSGIHFDKIRLGCIILVEPDRVSQTQPFQIYRITKSTDKSVQIDARHIAYNMSGIPISPFIAYNSQEAFSYIRDHNIVACPFNFQSDIKTMGGLKNPHPQSMWDLLGPDYVLKAYGGEYIFDRFNVTLVERRGSDKGITLRYGKNLSNFEQDENFSKCYSGVYPYWVGNDKIIDLPEPNKIVSTPGTHERTNILMLDVSSEIELGEDQDEPTTDEILAFTEDYILKNEVGVPDISWTLTYESLTDALGSDGSAVWEQIEMGDTVTVFFTDFGISGSARVVKIEYDPLSETYKKIELGRTSPELSETIANQQKDTLRFVDKTAEYVSRTLTKEEIMYRLTNGGTEDGIFLDPDTKKIMLSATYMQSGTIKANTIKLMDKFAVYDPTEIDPETKEPVLGGYIGFIRGNDGRNDTYGVCMMDRDMKNFIIATTGGISNRFGDSYMFCVPGTPATADQEAKRGSVTISNADLYVDGDIHQNVSRTI